MLTERTIENLKRVGRNTVRTGAAALWTVGSALMPHPVMADESAAFRLTVLGPTDITCYVEDPDCGLEATIVATNVSGRDMYRPTWFTGIHSEKWARIYGLEYRLPDGRWDWGMNEIDQTVKPGETITTQVRFKPPQQYELNGRIVDNPPGRFEKQLYADAYDRKTWLNPPDDIPFGGSHIDLVVNRVSAPIESEQ